MTIAQRLYLMIGAAMLGLFIVAGAGLYQMNKVFEVANWGNVNVVPSLVLLDDTRVNQLQVSLNLTKHVLSNSEAEMAEYEKALKNSRAVVLADFKKYEDGGCFGISCISDDKDKELLNKAKAAYIEYDAMIEDVLIPSRKGDAGLTVAREMLNKTAVAARKMDTAIVDQFSYNTEIG